jgi:putative transposase
MSVVVHSLRGVKQVIKVRLLPTEAEAALDTTLRTCNAAATWLSQQMHATRVFRKFDAQRRFYVELRERFDLGAQPTIRVLGKVADAYTSLRANVTAGNLGPPGSDEQARVGGSPITFRWSAAQPFDARCLSWRFPSDASRNATLPLWTIAGASSSSGHW